MRQLPIRNSRPRFGSQKLVVLCFISVLVFFFAIHHARTHYYRDPTSKFFDPQRAYDAGYSVVRRDEAEEFVNFSGSQPFRRNSTSTPLLCVGMLTIARPSGTVYFRNSIGSILAGLTQLERDAIYLVPFIGHTNASEHPAYSEPWLNNVADFVMTYNNSKFMDEEKFAHIQGLEIAREKNNGVPDREKHMFDYTQVLKECGRVKAKYVAIIEDDALAQDGWFHRTRKGLQAVEEQTKAKGQNGFFYLRLFYTEANLGWNSEEWPTYIRWIVLLLPIALLGNAFILYLLRRRPVVQHHPIGLMGASLIFNILTIVFFFLAGRVSMLPLSAGVHKMSKYGCCAQALVFPAEKVPLLAQFYTDEKIGFVDTLAEHFADEHPEKTGLRWALTPSVFQHVGGRSSKGDAEWEGEVKYVNGKMIGERMWNFAFEVNDAKVLRKEHEIEAELWEREMEKERGGGVEWN